MDAAAKMRDTIAIRLYNMGLKQKELADSIGVPASTLNSWLKRGRDIPAQYIMGIADFLDCNPIYLLTGDITFQVDVESLKPHKSADAIRGVSDDALKVAALWDRLDEPGRAIIMGDLYKRLEAASDEADHDDGQTLKEAR